MAPHGHLDEDGKNTSISSPSPPPPAITIYSKDGCKYCVMVKEFLRDKNIPFQDTKLEPEAADYTKRRDELILSSGRDHRTFPWVFVMDEFVGGYNDVVKAFNTEHLHELCRKHGVLIEGSSFNFDEPDF